ncbi:MAG: THUMP domain-containing protein, partial [Desulfomonilia bacterium]|nr:THUMP domain-containing protein [Desulfomonilia bacterium]
MVEPSTERSGTSLLEASDLEAHFSTAGISRPRGPGTHGGTMFSYQKNDRFFAQISDGLESLGCEELVELGGRDVMPTYRGIYFSADAADLYRITYSVRAITRILAPLITFDCHSTKYLYKTAMAIPWADLFGLDETFSVSANVSHSLIRHSQYAALCVKDAIVDSFRDRFGSRPNVEKINPDIAFNLHLFKDTATIHLDLSGGSLHRRGYRKESGDAPMQETLAGAIIRLTGWNGETPLIDP